MNKNNNDNREEQEDHPHLWQQWQSIDDETTIPGGYTSAMKEYIDGKIRPVRHIPHWKGVADWKRATALKRVANWKWAAAAACILAIAVASWNLSVRKDRVAGNSREEIVRHAKQELLENNTTKIMTYLLPDSSSVNIYPSGKIQFHKDFSTESKREIILYGQAVFQVKPGNKPFSVRSGPLTTTALGTVFEVKESKENIAIRLVKGKVVVTAETALPGWGAAVYLLPGEQVYYDPYKGQTVKSNTIPNGNKEVRPAAAAGDKTTMEFDNEPLASVFNKLEKRYQRRILFEKQEMRQQYFTGVVFPEGDSLETILTIIVKMKGLKLSDSAGAYHIHK